jgi:hypothetical protein
MDNVIHFLAMAVAAGVLLVVAFPHHLIPQTKGKKKRVGSCYWGFYEGQATDEPEAMKTIEVKEPSGREKVVAGSQMYAAGRGTSFRQ